MPATSSCPSALRRAATTAEVPTRRVSAVESSTLLQALEAVPDPRRRRGRRHRLQSVLYLALGAVLAGADWMGAFPPRGGRHAHGRGLQPPSPSSG